MSKLTEEYHKVLSLICTAFRALTDESAYVDTKKENKSFTAVQSPGLAVVLVGNRGDSETYVRSKKKACEEIGIVSFGTDLTEDVTQEELLKVCNDELADIS